MQSKAKQSMAQQSKYRYRRLRKSFLPHGEGVDLRAYLLTACIVIWIEPSMCACAVGAIISNVYGLPLCIDVSVHVCARIHV